MTFKQALEYVRSKRAVVCPNYGFQNELKKYEQTIKKGLGKVEQVEESKPNFPDRKGMFNINYEADSRGLSVQGQKRFN